MIRIGDAILPHATTTATSRSSWALRCLRQGAIDCCHGVTLTSSAFCLRS